MKKIVVTELTQAKKIVLSDRYKNNRLEYIRSISLETLNKESISLKDSIEQILKFLSGWPMYMDGDIHKQNRISLISAMKLCTTFSEGLSLTCAQELALKDIIDEYTIESTARKWHEAYFGLQDGGFEIIMGLALEMGKYFDAHRNEDWDPVSALCKLNLAREWVKNHIFPKDCLIGHMRKAGINEDLCIAVATDAIYPIKASIGSLIHYICGISNTDEISQSDNQISALSLFIIPPFRYLSRIVPEAGDFEPEAVIIDILECHKGANRPDSTYGLESLSFGKGKHQCPGTGATIQFLSAISKELRGRWRNRDVKYTYESVQYDDGKCRVSGQKVYVGDLPKTSLIG